MADYDLKYTGAQIDALLDTANELKTAGYIYKGVATPSTNPGTPTERVAYFASEPGTYTNFGGIVITSGLYSLTYASGTWTGTQMSAGSDTEVVQTTGQSTTDVMSQKAVTDATSITLDNEFVLADAAATTNNVIYITPSKTAAGVKWTIKKVADTSRQGQVSIPRLTQGKTYKIAFDVENTINSTITCALDYFSGQSGSNVTTALRQWLSGDIVASAQEGHFETVIIANYSDIDYICFRFTQPTINQYLLVTGITIQEVSSVKEEIVKHKEIVDGMTIGNTIDTEADVEFSDANNHVILQLIGGHIKTKYFDSSLVYDALGKFNGKHIAIIGDSVSTYQGYIPTGWKTHYTSSNLASVNLTYWWQLCNALGMTFNNCSYSTSRASGNSQATSVSGGDGECAGCSDVRINALSRDGKTPDIVLIYLGINDWANNVPIGTFCEGGALPAEGVINDFSAAYALMLNKIRTNYPTIRIFCCTIFPNLARESVPPFRGGSSPYTNGNPLYAYNQAIRDVARIMGCDVIDLAACGINNISAPTTTHDEKVHPNATGFSLMFKKIMTEIISKY